MTKRYNIKKFRRINQGYTIIETMIAVSLFIIIIMMGMNALLNANVLHKKSQSMRSIIDNLSFIMEDMGRNMRTGINYHCVVGGVFTDLTTPKSCISGGGIAFKNSIDGSTWVYKIETQNGGTTYNIYRSIDGGTTWVQLNPPEVLINSISGFSVLGAEPPSAIPPDYLQPFITIRLVGKITTQNVTTPFSLQTSVSERVIDI